MSKVKIKNTSSYRISIILDNVRYRRDLNPGAETTLPEDVFEEFNYDNGCRNYVRNGFIKVITDDEEIKEAIPEMPKDVDMDAEILVTKKSVQELALILKDASPAMKDKIVAAAIKHSAVDAARVALIKTHCGVDVLNALNLQRSME
jgi:TusA-related sulfurtransferase